jgi:hypothetical protein
MTVSLSEFFAVILVVTFVCAGVSIFLDRRRDRVSAGAIKRSTIRCRICGCAYPESSGHQARECPECGRENIRGRDRRLG